MKSALVATVLVSMFIHSVYGMDEKNYQCEKNYWQDLLKHELNLSSDNESLTGKVFENGNVTDKNCEVSLTLPSADQKYSYFTAWFDSSFLMASPLSKAIVTLHNTGEVKQLSLLTPVAVSCGLFSSPCNQKIEPRYSNFYVIKQEKGVLLSLDQNHGQKNCFIAYDIYSTESDMPNRTDLKNNCKKIKKPQARRDP